MNGQRNEMKRNNYLDLLADDEIIEVFHNINVTKKLLDDNMVLDIDKVTESDLAAIARERNAPNPGLSVPTTVHNAHSATTAPKGFPNERIPLPVTNPYLYPRLLPS